MVEILFDIPMGPVLDFVGDRRKERTVPFWALTSYRELYVELGQPILTKTFSFNKENAEIIRTKTKEALETILSRWLAHRRSPSSK